MWKHWKRLGASLTALLVLGLVTTIPTSEAKKPEPPPEPEPGPITVSPEDGVLLTWVEPGSSDWAHDGFLEADDKIVVAGSTSSEPFDNGLLVIRYDADGRLDPTFGDRGVVTTDITRYGQTAWAAAPYPGGKILAAGRARTTNYMQQDGGNSVLARYNADGSVDRDFGGKGKSAGVALDECGTFHAVTVQPDDGKIVAAGSTYPGFAVARYTPAGALDSSFGTEGFVETVVADYSRANAVAMHMGGILAVGVANNSAGTEDFALVRYLQNGDLDPSFGGTGIVTSDFSPYDRADAATVDADDNIVVVGTVSIPSGPGTLTKWAVARYLPWGDLDPTFGELTDPEHPDSLRTGLVLTDVTGGIDEAHAVAIQPWDGKIVSAGFAWVPGTSSRMQFAVVRHNEDGTLDEGFGSGGKVVTRILDTAEAESVVIQSDGKIVAIGWAYDGVGHCIAMVRYNSDGSPDDTFGVAEEP